MALLFAALFLEALVYTAAEYKCLCNYHSSTVQVRSQPVQLSTVIGLMQQFNCKPIYAAPRNTTNWRAIQFERQVGYVEEDSYIHVQLCQGSPQNKDLVTPSTKASRRTSIMTNTLTTMHTNSQSTMLPVTYTTTSTAAPTTMPPSTPRTPRLASIQATKVELTATPITNRTTTIYTTTTTSRPTPVPHGDISKCPDHVRKDAIRSKGYLNQYGRYCFVLNPLANTWGNAEQHCKVRGGHLLTIQNAPEQEFFTNYLKSHHYVESVFIGLTDSEAEGTYQWISGAPVTYTNWASDHNDPRHHHASDDCVVMKTDGTWDDVYCGISLIEGIGALSKHHFICQYGFNAPAPNILSIIGGIIRK